MSFTDTFAETEPERASIDAGTGWHLLEFGVPWCPHCQRAQPAIAEALAGLPGVRHTKIEDGRGRPLGRSFRVTLWPTLVLLQAGREVGRVVRPTATGEISELLDVHQAR